MVPLYLRPHTQPSLQPCMGLTGDPGAQAALVRSDAQTCTLDSLSCCSTSCPTTADAWWRHAHSPAEGEVATCMHAGRLPSFLGLLADRGCSSP